MLSKKYRIQKNLFPLLQKSGRTTHRPFFVYNTGVYGEIGVENTPKCAVIVSKTVAKHAVDRNKIRRNVYRILQKHTKNLKNNRFYLFFMKKGSDSASEQALEQEILEIIG